MKKYVDLEMIKNEIAGMIENEWGYDGICEDIDEIFSKIPAADVAPVVHARWIHARHENCYEQFEIVKCSNCGIEAYAAALFVRYGNYCPNCGAKMEIKPETKNNWNGGCICPEIENKQTGNNAEKWLNKKMNIGGAKNEAGDKRQR